MPQRIIRSILAVALALCSAPAFAQSPKAATYITDEEVKKVLVQPGVDHTIRVVDIGNENLAVGIIHRGARAAIELAGDPGFLDGVGEPLVLPSLEIDGVTHRLSEVGMAWERAFGWVPTFTASLDSLVIRGTIFSPFGRVTCGRLSVIAGLR